MARLPWPTLCKGCLCRLLGPVVHGVPSVYLLALDASQKAYYCLPLNRCFHLRPSTVLVAVVKLHSLCAFLQLAVAELSLKTGLNMQTFSFSYPADAVEEVYAVQRRYTSSSPKLELR